MSRTHRGKRRLFWGIAGVCLLMVLVPVAYEVGRVVYEKRLVERVIARQPPGVWGGLRYPLVRSGPLIVGVPEDDESQRLFRRASRLLTKLYGAKLPAGQCLWCVRMRAINLGRPQRFARDQLNLRLRPRFPESPGYGVEQSAEEVLTELRGKPFPYRGLLEAAKSEIPGRATMDWLAVFAVSTQTSLDLRNIDRVEANLGAFGLMMERPARSTRGPAPWTHRQELLARVGVAPGMSMRGRAVSIFWRGSKSRRTAW